MPGIATRKQDAWASGRTLRALAVGALALSSAACSTKARDPVGIDCSQEDPYTLEIAYGFEGDVAPGHWFGYNDETPVSRDSGPNRDNTANGIEIRTIDGGRCLSQEALVLTMSGRNAWGGSFGNWFLVDTPLDAGGYEGLSFWARAPFDKSLTVVLEDNTSAARTRQVVRAQDAGTDADAEASIVTENIGDCEITDFDAAIVNLDGSVSTPDSRQNNGATLAAYDSGVRGPNDCGNSFTRRLVLSNRWKFYTLPFDSFAQAQQPNLSPEGINRSAIHGLLFRIPISSTMELWLVDIGLYSRG
jgi:hypothetical protein